MKRQANEIMKESIDKGYQLDVREWCAYITDGLKTMYLDWSMPQEGLIVDIWYN